jgi:hypothetical protein
MNERGTQWVIGAAVVLVVVLIGGWFVTAKVRSSYEPGGTVMADMQTSTSTIATASSTPTSAGDSIMVVTQSASASVKVLSVTLAQKSWLAIRNSEGTILGAALVQAGSHSYVMVPLLRSTISGETYTAVLYTANDSKTFDLKSLTLIKNADGTDFVTTFKAQ